jgi:hypothetical protein
MMCPVKREMIKAISGQDNEILKGSGTPGGHAGGGQRDQSTTGGSSEPTNAKPPNEGRVESDAGGEIYGSEFQMRRRMAQAGIPQPVQE